MMSDEEEYKEEERKIWLRMLGNAGKVYAVHVGSKGATQVWNYYVWDGEMVNAGWFIAEVLGGSVANWESKGTLWGLVSELPPMKVIEAFNEKTGLSVQLLVL